MKTFNAIGLMCCVLALAGCNAGSSVTTDSHRRIKIGMHKEQVIKELGQPASKQEFVKSDKPVWGVIEAWLTDLSNGDKIEIWSYTGRKGTDSVYFLNGSEKVWHTSFVKKGVVF